MSTRLPGRCIPALILALLWGSSLPAAPLPDEETLRQQALKLNDVRGDDLIDREIDALRKQPDYAKKLLAVAVKMAKEKDQPFNYTGAYILGAVARELQDADAGALFFRICIEKAEKLQSSRRLTLASISLMELLFENGKYKEAEQVGKEFLAREGNEELRAGQILATLRMVQIVALQGRTDEAFKLLDPFLKTAPDHPEILKVHGWLLRHAGKYDEAVKTYEELLKKAEQDETKDAVRYVLSGLYIELGNVDKAADQLQVLLKRHPDNATFNNDLGYIWADHDKNLDEAEKLIRKALDKEPTNPAFLDSMGWVLFKKKRYKEAKEYLLKAVADPAGQHAEILDHLGDVHMALGEKAEALAAWKKALDAAGKTPREQKRKAEIEKKLKAAGQSGPTP